MTPSDPYGDGLVTRAAWQAVRGTPQYAELSAFSRDWFRQNRGGLRRYRKWTAGNPLENWSRSFEYPWTLRRIEEWVDASRVSRRVFDAGSGITFFPFYLAERFGLDIQCLDADPAFGEFFERAKTARGSVAFACAPLHDLARFPDQSFDLGYCISVLEHVPPERWDVTIAELHRVLIRGGRLLLTLDVSLDGMSSIARSDLPVLLEKLVRWFRHPASPAAGLLPQESAFGGLASTDWFRDELPELLPWRVPFRQKFGLNRQLRPTRPDFASLACLAVTLEKV